ncbi:hypothetical protein BDR04DRAFT_1204782 [Suillus decipiens]|nr:hypothetical protein BDR04DRAFT_1204782 [Suillus decipiens]
MMDNASNNDIFMLELEIELEMRGISFDHAGNHPRCFPYVVNLAVQAILKELKENPVVPVLEAPAHLSALTDLHVYTNTLSNEPIRQCCGIVNACRHSGQHHHCLQAVIEEGNNNGYWKSKLPDDKETLPVLQLLQDCSTHWSSTFKMIDHVLTLHLEIQNADLAHLSMDLKDVNVLHDIHQIIEVPHAAQELLTSEHTPTLSMALPTYELLQTKWTKLKGTIW